MGSASDAQSLRSVDRSFFKKYDIVGPRYTSYPTAPEWSTAIRAKEFTAHLDGVKASRTDRALSIYLHIPFCMAHCTFCACNVIISPKGREVSDPYLDQLDREAAIQAEHIDTDRPVTQFHWGGGTPTYLDVEQLRRTHAMISGRFNLVEGAEQSIEIHPPITTDEQLHALADLGFNRLSMGVQDFNEKTQRAINRMQSFERTGEITEIARSLGFKGINYDLIYGLPYQTEATFGETLDKVFRLRPDRIALYNFAYLPERLAHQRTIDVDSLPSAETKFQIFLTAYERFLAEGYRFIGMDHFALPDDELSKAFDNETLHRNFMGFTTKAGTDLIGMGVSSISSVQNGFAQNVKKLTQYTKAVKKGRLATERGLILTPDDEIRRRVIGDLMCRSTLDKGAIGEAFGIDFNEYFAEELGRLEPFIIDGLIENRDETIELSFVGRLLVRNVAMVFDAHLQRKLAEGQRQTFSRTL